MNSGLQFVFPTQYKQQRQNEIRDRSVNLYRLLIQL